MSINPYYVGYNIFRDIEKRWNGEDDADHSRRGLARRDKLQAPVPARA